MALALGMFDGVHIGHQSILRRTLELAKSMQGTSAVLTFSNHPLSILAPDRMPLQLGNEAVKRQFVESIGMDLMISLPFTRSFADISAEDFLRSLADHLAPRYVVTGQNFTFGRQGKGNYRMLLREAERYGFRAEICSTVLKGGKAASSTRIRKLIAEGELSQANEMLGHPFRIIERVVHGDRRGRTLGFPTANLPIRKTSAMLPNGAYAVGILWQGKWHGGIANIGDNPTFEGCQRRIEVNIFDFSSDIYDQEILVDFYQKLREEKKFSSVEGLVSQLHRDKAMASALWRKVQGEVESVR